MVEIFSSLSSISGFNVIASEAIISKLKIEKKIFKQIISWLIPILISIVGFIFGLGMFAEFGTITTVNGWAYTLMTGVGSGLISNGLYEIEYVKKIIDFIKTFNFKVNK